MHKPLLRLCAELAVIIDEARFDFHVSAFKLTNLTAFLVCDICTYGLRTDGQLSQEAFCIQCFILINLSREVAVTAKFGPVW